MAHAIVEVLMFQSTKRPLSGPQMPGTLLTVTISICDFPYPGGLELPEGLLCTMRSNSSSSENDLVLTVLKAYM